MGRRTKSLTTAKIVIGKALLILTISKIYI